MPLQVVDPDFTRFQEMALLGLVVLHPESPRPRRNRSDQALDPLLLPLCLPFCESLLLLFAVSRARRVPISNSSKR